MPHGSHFAVAEVLMCSCQGVEDEDPALDEAGSGCKAHYCCCWLPEDLPVTIARVDLCLPYLEYVRER